METLEMEQAYKEGTFATILLQQLFVDSNWSYSNWLVCCSWIPIAEARARRAEPGSGQYVEPKRRVEATAFWTPFVAAPIMTFSMNFVALEIEYLRE